MDTDLLASVSLSETMAGFAANEDLAERALTPDLSPQQLPEPLYGVSRAQSSPVPNSSDPRLDTCQELPIGRGVFDEDAFWNELVRDKDCGGFKTLLVDRPPIANVNITRPEISDRVAAPRSLL